VVGVDDPVSDSETHWFTLTGTRTRPGRRTLVGCAPKITDLRL